MRLDALDQLPAEIGAVGLRPQITDLLQGVQQAMHHSDMWAWCSRKDRPPLLTDQQSSITVYWQPQSLRPEATGASAVSRIEVSWIALPMFHEFQPIGGAAARYVGEEAIVFFQNSNLKVSAGLSKVRPSASFASQ